MVTSGAANERAFDQARCVVCGSWNTALQYKAVRYRKKPGAQAWDMHRCRRCGLLFVWPLPTDAEVAGVYADVEYRAEDLRDHSADAFALEDHILKLLERHGVHPPGRLLDVGCGAGHFLNRARDRGWLPLGQEIALHSARFARDQYGVEILTEPIETVVPKLAPASFDLITLIGVIEHVPDPVGFLSQLRRLMKPGGSLFILTDNVRSWLHFLLRENFPWIMPPEHLQLFTPRSIDVLLVSNGFRRSTMETRETIFADAAVRGVSMLIGRGRTAPRGLRFVGQAGVWLLAPVQRLLWSMKLGAQLYVIGRLDAALRVISAGARSSNA